MAEDVTLNVHIGGSLGEFVAANVGADGAYENVGEYVRDLVRRDKERKEAEMFERLKAELARAFAAPESTYSSLDALSVIRRDSRRADA